MGFQWRREKKTQHCLYTTEKETQKRGFPPPNEKPKRHSLPSKSSLQTIRSLFFDPKFSKKILFGAKKKQEKTKKKVFLPPSLSVLLRKKNSGKRGSLFCFFSYIPSNYGAVQ
jgi:hypothetical protein